ncbi:tetratricopeptide repeat protein [Paenibacillus sp. 1011MAR3C5]|uniref:tetratricopeptide repeat protein n=1 Tax=Paenibacillus sp. 1011MAR3C5 TaxID=1675787 RepID=UPI000E6B981B|nr:tetratricopeptide repeat protein [Paenibacillus sp. 1011MAR3C5]RJE84675.1 tetratricopeptide repeat protein [Paenibacillus sp. 1011MAR3C5]
MIKFTFLFLWLSWLLGNPIIAVIVLLVILYALDRRFVGLTPSLWKPFKRRSRISKLRQHIASSPSDVSSKHELARLLIESKKFKEAAAVLEPLQAALAESAEYWDDLGYSYLQQGDAEKGEAYIERALKLNPKVKYGAPYLRLAAARMKHNPEQALKDLEDFQSIHSSSCEAYDKLATIYKEMGQTRDSKLAVQEGLRLYKALPRYRKRSERKWAVRLLLKK